MNTTMTKMGTATKNAALPVISVKQCGTTSFRNVVLFSSLWLNEDHAATASYSIDTLAAGHGDPASTAHIKADISEAVRVRNIYVADDSVLRALCAVITQIRYRLIPCCADVPLSN